MGPEAPQGQMAAGLGQRISRWCHPRGPLVHALYAHAPVSFLRGRPKAGPCVTSTALDP